MAHLVGGNRRGGVALMVDWPGFGDIIDLSPLYDILFFGIMLFGGILAFKMLPRGLNIIVGFGLIIVGFAELLGYIQVV